MYFARTDTMGRLTPGAYAVNRDAATDPALFQDIEQSVAYGGGVWVAGTHPF